MASCVADPRVSKPAGSSSLGSGAVVDVEGRVEWAPRRPSSLRRILAAAHLLGFEVFVEEIKSFLIARRTAGDGEHTLAGLIMGCFGDGDPCA